MTATFRNPPSATTALVIGQTHDPFTPHQWAPRLAADLEDQTLPNPGARC